MATFEVGHKKVGGRVKGTPNKAGLPWKELVTNICQSAPHQDRLSEACLERPDMLFKAAEHAFGKPTERHEISGEFRMIEWPDNEGVKTE